MEKFKITGLLKEIGKEVYYSTEFKKKSFILETNLELDKHDLLQFELFQDNCNIIDNFSLNDFIEVEFFLKGRAYDSQQGFKKYYNTLKAVGIKKAI